MAPRRGYGTGRDLEASPRWGDRRRSAPSPRTPASCPNTWSIRRLPSSVLMTSTASLRRPLSTSLTVKPSPRVRPGDPSRARAPACVQPGCGSFTSCSSVIRRVIESRARSKGSTVMAPSRSAAFSRAASRPRGSPLPLSETNDAAPFVVASCSALNVESNCRLPIPGDRQCRDARDDDRRDEADRAARPGRHEESRALSAASSTRRSVLEARHDTAKSGTHGFDLL